ncbi:sacsin N-terminal ATP-binding-like domain-containing protein [Tepidibacter sp. Z1-5]|uniref:sacsin N-terminal ATP-binding-like domain-containing protein n=1 Tax=Tepidibacter sp. Z1-5 TaxID=3134138 RepID=UPI0030C2285B
MDRSEIKKYYNIVCNDSENNEDIAISKINKILFGNNINEKNDIVNNLKEIMGFTVKTDLINLISKGNEQDVQQTKGYDNRFISEFMQNCEDARKKQNFETDKCFNIAIVDCEENKFKVTISYDEKGFDFKDIIGFVNTNLSSKENDSEAIGKYGIGLKSVFNITRFIQVSTSNGIIIKMGKDENDKAIFDIYLNEDNTGTTKICFNVDKIKIKEVYNNEEMFIKGGSLIDFRSLLFTKYINEIILNFDGTQTIIKTLEVNENKVKLDNLSYKYFYKNILVGNKLYKYIVSTITEDNKLTSFAYSYELSGNSKIYYCIFPLVKSINLINDSVICVTNDLANSERTDISAKDKERQFIKKGLFNLKNKFFDNAKCAIKDSELTIKKMLANFCYLCKSDYKEDIQVINDDDQAYIMLYNNPFNELFDSKEQFKEAIEMFQINEKPIYHIFNHDYDNALYIYGEQCENVNITEKLLVDQDILKKRVKHSIGNIIIAKEKFSTLELFSNNNDVGILIIKILELDDRYQKFPIKSSYNIYTRELGKTKGGQFKSLLSRLLRKKIDKRTIKYIISNIFDSDYCDEIDFLYDFGYCFKETDKDEYANEIILFNDVIKKFNCISTVNSLNVKVESLKNCIIALYINSEVYCYKFVSKNKERSTVMNFTGDESNNDIFKLAMTDKTILKRCNIEIESTENEFVSKIKEIYKYLIKLKAENCIVISRDKRVFNYEIFSTIGKKIVEVEACLKCEICGKVSSDCRLVLDLYNEKKEIKSCKNCRNKLMYRKVGSNKNISYSFKIRGEK